MVDISSNTQEEILSFYKKYIYSHHLRSDALPIQMKEFRILTLRRNGSQYDNATEQG